MSAATVVAWMLCFMAVLLTALSLQVSRLRMRHRVSFGDGGHKDLLIAIRAHGNALEQTCVFGLLALAGALLVPLGHTVLTASCVVFSLARVTHAVAVFARQLRLRQAAHLVTVLTQGGLALWLLGRLLGPAP